MVEASPLSLAVVSQIPQKLLVDKGPGIDEIHPEILNVLDIVGLSWLIGLFRIARTVCWDSACGLEEQNSDSHV